MTLDIRTLAILLALMSMAAAVALYLFYRLLPQGPGLKNAAIGAACQSVGSILLISRDFVPPVISIVGANGLYFLSYAFLYQTTREFSDKTTEWRSPAIIIALLLPFTFLTGHEYVGLRIALNAVGIATLAFMASWVLLKGVPAYLPARRGVAIALLGIGMLSVYRLLNLMINPPGTAAFLDMSNQYPIFIGGIISVFIYAAAVIVMTSERLRVELQQQLKKVEYSRQIADNALREQKNFIAMLSHEFRTPLGIIKANVDAIRATDPVQSTFTDESLSRISNASTRLTTMVDGCLNDEWISNTIEKGELQLQNIDLTATLKTLTSEYGVDFIDNTSGELPLLGDPNLIPILFSSLIDNARKYARTTEGVKVKCSVKGEQVMVEVIDDGPGIPAEEHELVFDKYYRIKNGNKRPGTGLGLYFVKRIAEQHGGKVEIETHDATLFRITLPLRKD